MKRESFNGGWIFYTKENPEEKTAVRLPHDAMQYEERIPKLKNATVLQQHTTTNSLEVFCSAASKHFFF